MLSDLQRLSSGLIIYSVILSDFEKPDFKNDALAGVRANYFNSNGLPQNEKTDIMLDGRAFGLSYSMRRGEPLSWKVTSNKRPYQTVNRSDNGSYCVVTYADNGIVVKRIYFDAAHNWIRTEYYDKDISGVLRGRVSPRLRDRVVTLLYEYTGEAGEKRRETLYPSVSAPKKRCSALIYSNTGMIWYDKSFKPDEISEKENDYTGFVFELSLFNSQNKSGFDLRDSQYLSAEDYQSQSAEAEPVSEKREYSAYDRIEQILYEAHKTNKNIFGELANHASELESDEESSESSAPESVSEEKTVSQTERQAEDEAASEAEAEVEETPEEVESARHDAPIIERADESEPDKELDTEGGAYSYYGELDENGRRTGRGRVAAPDGVTVYDGGYSDDKRDGFGVCYYKDGSPNYVGGWKNGSRSGSGVGFRRSDGTMHVGKWDDNSPVGIGARFEEDGSFIDVCQYSGGVKNGKGISLDENGNVVVSRYIDGELVSEWVIEDTEPPVDL